MGMIKVKNLNGTSNTPKCTEGVSWIKHWENYMCYSKGFCSRKGCCQSVEVGGHVKKVDSTDDNEYIVPLCGDCNKMSSEIVYEVKEDLLVPVSHARWPSGKSCKKS